MARAPWPEDLADLLLGCAHRGVDRLLDPRGPPADGAVETLVARPADDPEPTSTAVPCFRQRTDKQSSDGAKIGL